MHSVSVIYAAGQGNILVLHVGKDNLYFYEDHIITLTLKHKETRLVFKLTAELKSANEYFLQMLSGTDDYKIYLTVFEILNIENQEMRKPMSKNNKAI